MRNIWCPWKSIFMKNISSVQYKFCEQKSVTLISNDIYIIEWKNIWNIRGEWWKLSYFERISALTRSVLGFDAATAVSTVFPISSSPSSVMKRIDPIAEYVSNKIITPAWKKRNQTIIEINFIDSSIQLLIILMNHFCGFIENHTD